MPKLATDKYCTGCLACIDICKHNAIKTVIKNGLTYVSISPSKCVNCRACERVCPIITPVKKNPVSNMHVFGGWCKDQLLRKKAASGGAFTGLAQAFFLKFERAVVIGAKLENNRVKHIVIDNVQQIEELMNSKYIQSDTYGIYQKVKSLIKKNYPVLFSGTPCQIAALYGYMKRHNDLLYTIEIICHGIAGNEALDIHLNKFNSSHIYSFRDKKENQYTSQHTTIDIKGEKVRLERKDDTFYKIFSGWLLDRKSCSNCLYSSLERVADFTIADFWGGPFAPNEYDKGVSLIITNNNRAFEFINHSQTLYLKETTLINAINSNPNLYDGYKFIQYHPIVLFPNFCRNVIPKKIWLNIVTNQMPWKLLWAIYKIFTIIHILIKKRKVLKKYKL